ncbi:strawberry notch-like NTP hydrolase domain-containing protein [Massilia orientalis]|uniref:Strawberry notch-like NTP hydrolase domain-containing protein n=1 Tax=Massilia orientalis TaxID=3050128 RepID=A0ACC7MG15_9BURK|nr:strawberry notch family protein [Massilia sp. YIM B02787]
MPSWFDLGTEAVKLRFIKEEGFKENLLILVGLTMGSPEWEACQRAPLNFKPVPTGKPFLIRPFSPTKTPMLSEFRTVFPLARQVQIGSAQDVRLRLQGGAKLSPQEIAITAAMRVAAPIGMNLMGNRVFERPEGSRFLVDAEGQRVEEGAMPAAFLLRADETNLVSCVRGFIAGLMAGSHADVADVNRFVDVLYGRGASLDRLKVEEVAQTIEVEMANRVLERHELAGDAAYREAQLLYENSPSYAGPQKGAGAIPLPAAVAAQELVRAFGGEGQIPIYIPQLNDGTVASLLGASYVTLTDPVDPESSEARLRAFVPTSVSFVERSFAESVPPHRQSLISRDDVTAESFAEMRAAMARRHANGLTILTFPEYSSAVEVDRQAEKERVNGLLRALQADYDVLGIGLLSPVMRRKMNLQSGLLMVTVGRKFSAKERELRGEDWVPRRQDTMYDWDALRTFTNDVLVRVHESAGHKMTAEEEAALRANENAENSYQLPYDAFSKNGDIQLMIPRNLAGPTYKALQNLQDRSGNIDEYVRNAIGFTDEQFAYLAPEQVDASALMVSALDRDKGFVLGDQTGAGKGATIATAVSYAWQRGLAVIFVTKQDSLFSDFYRDLKKTGLHTQLRPMVLNHSAQVVDQFSENLDKIASGVSRKKFTENFQFGLEGFDNPNLVFCTYSQFSKGEDSDKSEWIKSIAPKCIVIFDEAHIAAGDTSQLGSVCTSVAANAKAVVYSSATWLKDARQMSFYSRMLPASIDTSMVSEAMQAGGESIQEVFTAMLAEDGLFIRRERDASQLDITMAVDDARLAGNEKISDQVAVILQGLQRLCGVTDQVGRRLTRAQVQKLDTAQRFIAATLERANLSSRQAIEALRARAAQDANAPDGEADGGNDDTINEAARHAAALVANTYAVQLANEEAIANQAEPENEEFLAAGHAAHVIDAQSLAVDAAEALLDGAHPIEGTLTNLLDLRIEDLDLTAEMVTKLSADIGMLGEDGDALRRLQGEMRRIKRMIDGVKTQTTSFGSLLFTTQRTLNVALQARYAGERAVAKIQEGKKPIIFLEQTFEQRIKEALDDPDTVKNADGTYRIRPQTLKLTLRAMYDTVVRMTHVDADGNRIEGNVLDSQFMASEAEREAIVEGLRTLDDMIDQLPDDLYCSPIDTICNAIRQAGFTVGEATGRKYKVIDMQPDHWTVAPRPAHESKISNIERGFNFGDYDALVGNKAMSTGMSLHASEDFTDQRQRTEMFCQVFGDIVDYVQAIGRADRRGQVIPPEVEMLASGLQSEARIMMVHYAHLRKLYASATSNRSSRFELHELPDLFNNVGDASVRDFLQANPAIATRLGIEFRSFMPEAIHADGTEVNASTHGLAKRTVSRLDLLPDKESRQVYQEISYNFNEVVAELDAQGINPLRTNVLNMADFDAAAITASEDLLPARLNDHGEVDSVFDEAVELQTVTTRVKVAARKWDDVLAEIESNTQRMFFESRQARQAGQTPDFVPDMEVPAIYRSAGEGVVGPMTGAIRMVPSGLRTRVNQMFDAMLVMMRSSDAARQTADETVAARTSDENGNQLVTPTQVIERRRDWLLSHLQHFTPGQYVIVRERNFGIGEVKVMKGAVTSLTLPPRGRETNLARWVVTIQMAGWTSPERFTLADLYKKQFTGLDLWLPGAERIEDGLLSREVPDEFNAYLERDHVHKRYVLCGNLFRAASIAAKHKIGAGAVLQMPAEAPRRVINIRPYMTRESIYSTVPVELAPEGVTTLFCSTWSALNRPPSKNAHYWQEFLRSSLESRALHSAADSKNADVSIYWLPTRTTWQQDMQEELSMEEMAERSEVRTPHAQAEHLLAGVGARIRKTCLDRNEQSALATAINEELGIEGVKIERGRQTSATVRVLLRFTDDSGNRDSDEMIRHKLAVFSRHVMRATETRQFYSTSPAMRLLAMAVTERNREQSRAIREAAHEAQMMRRQMQRLHLNGEQPDQVDEIDGNDADNDLCESGPDEQRAA